MVRKTLSLVALVFALGLPSVGLDARSADAASLTDLQASQSTIQADMLQTLNDHRFAVGAPTIAADARQRASAGTMCTAT